MMKDPCPKGALMHPTDADNNKEHLLHPPSSNPPPPSSPRATAANPPRYNRRRRRSITFAENKTVAVFDPKSKACNAFELPRTEVFAPPPRTMSSDTMSLENEAPVVVEAEIDYDDDDDVPKPFVEEPTSEDASNTRSEETPEAAPSPLVLSQQEQRPSKDRPLVRLTVNLLATYQNIAVKEGCDDVVFTAKPMMADPTKMWRRLDQTLEDVSGKGGKKKKKQHSASEERKTKDEKKEQPETTTTPQKPVTDSGRDDSVETTAEITSVTTLSSSSEEVAVVMEVSEKDNAPKGDSPPTNDKPATPKQPVQGKLEHQKSPTSVTYLGQVDETTSDPPQSASAPVTNVPTEVEVETLETSTSTGSTAVESGHHKSSSSKKNHHHHHHHKSSSRGNSSGKKNKPPKSPSAYFPKKELETKKQKSLTLDDVIKPSRKSPRKGRSTRSLTAESVVSGRSSSSRKKSKSKKSLSRKRSSSLDAASRLTPDDIAKDLKQHRSKPSSSSKNKKKDEETKELTIQDLEKPVLKKSLSSRKKSNDNHHQSCSSLPTPKNSLSASESPAPPAETTTTGTPKRKRSRRRRASLQAGIPEPPLFIEFEEQQPSETDSKQDAPPPAAPSSPSPKGPPTSELDSLKDLYAQHYRSILNSPSRRQSQEEGRSPGTSGRTSSPHRRLDTSLGLVEKVLRDAACAMGHPESPTRTIPAEETAAATAAAERTPSPTRRRISQSPRYHEEYVPPSPLVPPEQEQNQKETSQRSRTISIGQPNHHQHVKKVRRKSATGVVTKTTKTKHTKQLTVVVIICSRFPNKAVKSRQETALTALREAGIPFDILDDGADPANDAILDELFDISGLSRGEEAYPQFFCMDESTPGPFMFKGNWNWFQKVLREGGGSLKRALLFSSRRASCRV